MTQGDTVELTIRTTATGQEVLERIARLLGYIDTATKNVDRSSKDFAQTYTNMVGQAMARVNNEVLAGVVRHERLTAALVQEKRELLEVVAATQRGSAAYDVYSKRVGDVQREMARVQSRMQMSGIFSQLQDTLLGQGGLNSALAGTAGELMGVAGAAGPVGAAITAVVGAVLGGAVQINKAINVFADFERGMAGISTLTDKLPSQLGATGREILDLSVKLGTGFTDIQAGLQDVLGAGVRGAEDLNHALALTEQAAKLAIAGQTETAVASDALTTILNSYKLSASDAKAVSDSLFTTVRDGKLSFNTLAGSIGNVTNLAAELEVPFAEVSAAVATMTANGIKGASAVDYLRSMLSSIQKPSDEASKLAATLGLKFDAQALAAKGLTGFLKDVMDATRGNKEQMATLFGGVEALSAAVAIASGKFERMEQNLRNQATAAGTTETAYQKMADTLSKENDKVKANWEKLMVNLGDAFAPFKFEVLKGVNEMLEGFNSFLEKTNRSNRQTDLNRQVNILEPKIALLEKQEARLLSGKFVIGTTLLEVQKQLAEARQQLEKVKIEIAQARTDAIQTSSAALPKGMQGPNFGGVGNRVDPSAAAEESGKFGYAFFVNAVASGRVKGDPKIQAWCADVAAQIQHELGNNLKYSNSAGQLRKNAEAAGYQIIDLRDARPGDLVFYKGIDPSTGKKYGASSGNHVETVASNVNGQITLVGSNNTSKPTFKTMYDPGQATVYRAPSSPFAQTKDPLTPTPSTTQPVTDAQIARARELLAAIEKAVKANDPKAWNAATAAMKRWEDQSDSNKAALDAVRATAEKTARASRDATEQQIQAQIGAARKLADEEARVKDSGTRKEREVLDAKIKAFTDGGVAQREALERARRALQGEQQMREQAKRDEKQKAEEQKRLAAELAAAQVDKAQATASRLATINARTLANFKGTAEERLALVKKLSQEEFDRADKIAQATRNAAYRAVAGNPNESALKQAAQAKYLESVEQARNTRLNAVRVATEAAKKAQDDWNAALEEGARAGNAALDSLNGLNLGGRDLAATAQKLTPTEKTFGAMLQRLYDMRGELSKPAVADAWAASLSDMAERGRITKVQLQELLAVLQDLRDAPEAAWLQDMQDAQTVGNKRYGDGTAMMDAAMRQSYGLGQSGLEAALKGYGVKSLDELAGINPAAAESIRRVYKDVLEGMERDMRAAVERSQALLDYYKAEAERIADEVATASEIGADDIVQRDLSKVNKLNPAGMLSFLGGAGNSFFGEKFSLLAEDARTRFMERLNDIPPEDLARLPEQFLKTMQDKIGDQAQWAGIKAKLNRALQLNVQQAGIENQFSDLGNVFAEFEGLDSKAEGYASTLKDKLIPRLQQIRDTAADPTLKKMAEDAINAMNGEVDAAQRLRDTLLGIRMDTLDDRHARGQIGEVDYINQRQVLLVEQENQRYRLESEGKSGKELEALEAQHQRRLAQIIQQGAQSAADAFQTRDEALAASQAEFDRVMGKTEPAYSAQIRSLEKLKEKFPEAAIEIDRLIEKYQRLQARSSAFDKFTTYASYVQQLAGAFGKLADATGKSDLGANLAGIGNLAGQVVSIAGKFASGDIVGGITGIITGLADMAAGFQKARQQAEEARKSFQDAFKIIDASTFSSFSTRSRGFFADLFAGGPEVVQQINQTAADIARTLESGVTGAFSSGIRKALNGESDVLAAVREGMRNAIIDAIVQAMVQGTIIKGKLGGFLTDLTNSLAGGNYGDAASAIQAISGALPATMAEFQTSLSPLIGALNSALGSNTAALNQNTQAIKESQFQTTTIIEYGSAGTSGRLRNRLAGV